MEIKLAIDDSVLVNKLARTEKNLAFSSVQALNDIAKQIQADARQDILAGMHVRNERFTLGQVKIRQFASVGRGIATAEVGIYPKARSFLSEFEQGGERPNLRKKSHPALIARTGSEARLSMDDVSWLLSEIKLRPYSVNPASKAAAAARVARAKAGRRRSLYYDPASTFWRSGTGREFLIPGVGVFERTGPSRTDLDMLWSVQHREINLRPLLHFYRISQSDWQQFFNVDFLRRLNKTWTKG